MFDRCSCFSKENEPKGDKDIKVLITWQGVTYYGRTVIQTSACLVQMMKYPYDQQNCSILFGSNIYSDKDLQVDLFNNSSVIVNGTYEENPEWTLVSYGAKKVLWDIDGGSYHFLQVYIVIRRRPGFYIYIVIVPSLLLSIMTPVLFWMPPSRPDRTTLGTFNTMFLFIPVIISLLNSRIFT